MRLILGQALFQGPAVVQQVLEPLSRLGLGVEDLMKKGSRSAPASQPFPTRNPAGEDNDNGD